MKTTRHTWYPLASLGGLNNRLHHLLPRFRKGHGMRSHSLRGEYWEPAVDIEEDGNKYLITADLPGIKKEDIDVRIQNGVLFLSGECQQDTEKKGRKFHHIERFRGSYQRSFRLPEDVIEQQLDAQFKNGVLKLALPKEPSKRRPSAHAIVIHS